MNNVTAVIVDRANYGRLKPILNAFEADDDFNLSVVCCGSTVLKRFHKPANDIGDRFFVTDFIYNEVEGSTRFSAINSMSVLMPQIAMAFKANKPDYVLLIGDRYETLAVATVAMMMGLCILHVQGGEQSGNVDNMIRHAISQLSHYHLPSTIEAEKTLLKMGELKSTILGVGCPTADLIKSVKKTKKYMSSVLCVYHPEDGINNESIVYELLKALGGLKKHIVMFWPNIDPNSEGINKVIRRYIEKEKPEWLEMIVNMPPEDYLSLLLSVKCCVGNSSSFVRDASFFGTPVVLVGNRQIGRVKTDNIKWVRSLDYSDLHLTIRKQMSCSFVPSQVYGVSGVSNMFVNRLKMKQPYFLKVKHV